MTITLTHSARYYKNLNIFVKRYENITDGNNADIRKSRMQTLRNDLVSCFAFDELPEEEHQHLLSLYREVERECEG